MKNLRDILDQENQSTDVKRQLHSTITLSTTIQNLQGKQIRISGLDTNQRQFTSTLKGMFQVQ